MIKKISTFLVFLLFTAANLFAQRGVHGPRVVTAANTVVNEYTAITTNSPATATSITVANSALNANGRFTGGLQPGDLIMIYQEQGAWIRNQGDVGPTDTTFGKITILSDYYSAGNWEYAQVLSVPNATTINLTCGLINGYFAGFNAFRSQVIRVPRYTTLTINVGGVLTCDDWNGTVGGVLAVEVDGNVIVNGTIDATGKGFRGGSLVGDNVTQFGTNTTYSASPNVGAERGEGIAGYQGDYTFFGGMYGRASAANGGAGGDAHNAGGGGGANGQNSTNPAAVWSGNGIPDPNGAYTAAWNLEPPVNTMTLRTAANSEGGGRGGYTFSGSNQNAGLLGPGQAGWGGDARNHQATGLGGRALAYDQLPGRFFLGGGGGAGDQNENYGGNGGDGGGLVYVMVFGSISGSGTVVSSGNAGSNAQGVPPNAGYSGADGAGGGGGGGAIVLNSVGTITGVTASANGGAGGNQVMVAGPLFFGTINEAEGPGGGGGGGHIAVSTGAITRITNGGNNGTTNSPALTEFPPNGATRGAPGTNNATVTNYNITVTNQSICATQSATITPTITGTPPAGYSFIYYSTATTGTTLGTGPSYNTGPLSAGTYTYWVGTCPGFFRVPVTITVNTTPTAPVLSSNSPICSGNLLTLFSNTVVGATYSWTGPNSFSSALEDPTIAGATVAATGTYSLTITAGVCASPQSTIAVVVNPTPAAPAVGSNSPRCVGQTLNLTANTVVGATYTWTGPNSFSSSLEDPTIVGATAAATGTYTLTITVGGCTSVQSTVAVIVSPTPAAPTLSSNTPVCSGNALNLFSNTVVGGTYSWTGPNTFSSALEDPTIASATVAATGTYSLTISVGGCTSPMSTTAVVVNPTPAAPIVGSNSPRCVGQTLNLTANTVLGATYTWIGPNSFSSALEDPTILGATAAATGTYTLTITVGGCISAQSTVAVIVAPTPAAPTLSSNTPVCSGNVLNLFSNTVAGGTYVWTGPNSFSSALEDPTVAAATVAATGTYSLTISVGGCTSPMSTTAVVVNPTPAAPTVASNSPLCSGQTLNLTANTVVGATYTWTGPNSFTSAIEDPSIVSATTAATGTYSLTITVGGCTSALSTVSVIVANTPSAPTLSSNTPVCSGNTLNLFANTVAGGTYAWTGPNSFSSALEDPTIAGVTAAATGTYSLTISIGGCTSPLSTVAVVVNPTPAAPTVGSNSPVCSGNALNLTANTVVGATYSWTGPNSFSSALEDPTIAAATIAATGTYSLTISVGGCTSAQSTVSVVVNPTPSAPTLSSNTPVCSGNALNLFSNTVVGGTYVWTGPNSFSSALEDPAIAVATIAASGTYSLTISVGGCTSALSTVAVVVNPTPAAPTVGSNTPFCEGQTLNLTANTVVGATYSWTGPNSFSSSLEDPSIVGATVAAAGTYSLTITETGCTSAQSTVSVVVNALPSVLAGLDVAICVGDSIPLTGSGTGTPLWSNSIGLSCTACMIPNASPSATTTYSLTITDVNGCVSTDDVLVTVNALPVATAGSDVTFCNGDSATLNGAGGGTYSWLPITDLSSDTIANPVASPTTTTTYTLLVTDGNGCNDTDAVVVTVNALPTVSAGLDQSMCPAGNVPLSGTGAVSYVWSGGPGLSCTNCQSPIATPAVTTTYFLVGTDANGCFNYDTVVVTVAPNLTITASADQTICLGDSALITTTGTGNYVWSPSGALSNSSLQSPMATPLATTTYTIVVTDVAGCTGTDSVTIFVNQPVVATASGATTICIGQSTSLTASAVGGNGTYTYTWNPGPITGSPVSVSPITTITYTLDVFDGVGCTNQQTVTVQVNPPITASVAQSAIGFCSGGSGSLFASGSGGDGNYSYNWLPTSGLSSSTVANPTANPTATTTYTVVVSDLCGSPVDSATVTVTVFLPRIALASASDSVGCAAFCPTFTGTSSGTCVSTIWDFGDGNSDTVSSAPSHCYGTPGVYTAIFICTDSNGCVAADTISMTAFATPVATATTIGGNTYSLQVGGTTDICFVDVTAGATSWAWSFNSNTSNLQSPCFTVSDTGTYTAILLVTNAAGCTDTVSITVIVENECTDLFIPSAFSPNGDTQNDMLFVYGSCINFMQFEIYSRWGEKVFSSTNPVNGWDGTWRGQNCESGMFTYVMTGQMNDGTAIKMQGNISLIR